MRITSLTLSNYRNLENGTFCFDENRNLICGDNGQGKTNLIEAIWLLTGARSFRGSRDGELVRFGEEKARLDALFYGQMRRQEVSLELGSGRRALLNGVPLPSFGELSQAFGAVVFSPVHLEIVKDSPERRRRFLDVAIGPIKQRYQKYLQNLHRILLQRNNLLRDLPYHPELLTLLEVYDEHLAQTAAVITVIRRSYIQKLNGHAGEIYREISGGREALTLRYLPGLGEEVEEMDGEALKERFLAALKRAREGDLAARSTSVGPHRDDLEILLDGRSARSFGSQGQQRSCVLALKLGEAKILKEVLDEPPVILLDDVLSELDPQRQTYLLSEMKGMQVFITCCDSRVKEQLGQGSLFLIEEGNLTQRE